MRPRHPHMTAIRGRPHALTLYHRDAEGVPVYLGRSYIAGRIRSRPGKGTEVLAEYRDKAAWRVVKYSALGIMDARWNRRPERSYKWETIWVIWRNDDMLTVALSHTHKMPERVRLDWARHHAT